MRASQARVLHEPRERGQAVRPFPLPPPPSLSQGEGAPQRGAGAPSHGDATAEVRVARDTAGSPRPGSAGAGWDGGAQLASQRPSTQPPPWPSPFPGPRKGEGRVGLHELVLPLPHRSNLGELPAEPGAYSSGSGELRVGTQLNGSACPRPSNRARCFREAQIKSYAVVPAKAGTQASALLDPCLRGDDTNPSFP